MVKQKQIIIDS